MQAYKGRDFILFTALFPESRIVSTTGACFSCVCDATEIVILSRSRERGVNLGNMEMESNQEGLFHYFVFYFQRGKCGDFLKEQRER